LLPPLPAPLPSLLPTAPPLASLPTLPPLPRATVNSPRVLAAEDMPGYRTFAGFQEAQRQLDREGVLLQYPVGLQRINAVEARRVLNAQRKALPPLPQQASLK
jgi:hypothetical protein